MSEELAKLSARVAQFAEAGRLAASDMGTHVWNAVQEWLDTVQVSRASWVERAAAACSALPVRTAPCAAGGSAAPALNLFISPKLALRHAALLQERLVGAVSPAMRLLGEELAEAKYTLKLSLQRAAKRAAGVQVDWGKVGGARLPGRACARALLPKRDCLEADGSSAAPRAGQKQRPASLLLQQGHRQRPA